jgi:putative hydrolase of the HAD superfamily
MIDLIAFDADDTLWHSEIWYARGEKAFQELMAHYGGELDALEHLHRVEISNLRYYGYGIKSFILSLIESAIECTRGHISTDEIYKILDMAKEMLAAEVELLEGVEESIRTLANRYRLMLITKGDSVHQEMKIEGSGLEKYFERIEIVREKDRLTYESLLARSQITADRFMMVGNSLRSDIVPILEMGGYAVYIPYYMTWAHEHVDHLPSESRRYFEIENLGQLPGLLEKLEAD